jgi:RPA family protein
MSQNNQFNSREVAKRVLLKEIEGVTEFEQGEDKYSPKYANLPTGEQANRVFFTGTVNNSRELSEDFYSLLVSQPDGSDIKVMGTEYTAPQPMEIIKQFASGELQAPVHVFVVGKPQESNNEDFPKPTIKPEYIRVVTPDEYKQALAETVEHVNERDVPQEVAETVDTL